MRLCIPDRLLTSARTLKARMGAISASLLIQRLQITGPMALQIVEQLASEQKAPDVIMSDMSKVESGFDIKS